MAVTTKNLPLVFSGVTIPGVVTFNSETLTTTWTARGQQTPTLISTVGLNESYWKEYTPGESVTKLVQLVPTIGQPPSEAAKYRERSGFRISKNVTPNLEEIIFADLLS